MGFKLGNEKRNYGKSSPIKRGNLRDGVDGEARNDGSIVISNKIKPGSKRFERVVKHEMQHKKDMESGKAKYDENTVTWDGKKHKRHEGMIQYNGKWYPEGHPDLPWEKSAIKAEKR
jgi:hypothetical protein